VGVCHVAGVAGGWAEAWAEAPAAHGFGVIVEVGGWFGVVLAPKCIGMFMV
jgi:hypothetical protein